MGCCANGSTDYMIDGDVKPGYQAVKEKFESLFQQDFDKVSQLCVYVGEEKVVDLWGVKAGYEADGNTLGHIYSSGKSVAAILIAVMVDKGHLSYDEPIASYWPEFAQNGKEKVKVVDVMRHESGLAVIGPFKKDMFSTEKIK